MNGPEALTSRAPPISFAPLTLGAGPLKRSTTHSGLEPRIRDNLVARRQKVLKILQRYLHGGRPTGAIDHPLRLIEHLDGEDPTLKIILRDIIQQGLQTVLNVSLLGLGVCHDVVAVFIISTLEAKKCQQQL